MPVIDAIPLIMHQIECEPIAVFTAKDADLWPRGLLARLVELSILHETRLADSVACDECEESCVITPDVRDEPRTGAPIGIHYCSKDGHGRITVEVARLRQWQSDFDSLAKWLCGELGLAPVPVAVVPKAIYRLGTRPTSCGPLDVFLARGLSRPAAYHVMMEQADRILASPAAAVIMPAHMPLPALWPTMKARMLTLADHLGWDHQRSCLDLAPLVDAVQSIHPAMKEERWITVTEGAQLLANDLPYLDLKKAAARISKAAGAGKFVTNGKTRDARRIERGSFDAWRLEQRDRDLDAEENGD